MLIKIVLKFHYIWLNYYKILVQINRLINNIFDNVLRLVMELFVKVKIIKFMKNMERKNLIYGETI